MVVFQTLARERALFNGAGNGAARLSAMATIAEPAFLRQRFEIVECMGKPRAALPELQFAHPRSVHNDSAARQDEQLARRCGMPAAIIGSAHRLNAQHGFASKRIDDRALAHAR